MRALREGWQARSVRVFRSRRVAFLLASLIAFTGGSPVSEALFGTTGALLAGVVDIIAPSTGLEVSPDIVRSRITTGPLACADYLFIGVRGSGEDTRGEGLGPTVSRVAGQFAVQAEAEAPGTTVRTLGIDYAAYRIPMTEGSNESVSQFVEGAWQGIVGLLYTIRVEQARCAASGERIVLAGYSQGSWLIHSALNWAVANDGLDFSTIVGVGLVSDPQRSSDAAEVNLGSAPADSYGIGKLTLVASPLQHVADWVSTQVFAEISAFAAVSPLPSSFLDVGELPRSVSGMTITLCNRYDPICGAGDDKSDLAVHAGYGTELNDFGASLATLALGTPATDPGGHPDTTDLEVRSL